MPRKTQKKKQPRKRKSRNDNHDFVASDDEESSGGWQSGSGGTSELEEKEDIAAVAEVFRKLHASRRATDDEQDVDSEEEEPSPPPPPAKGRNPAAKKPQAASATKKGKGRQQETSLASASSTKAEKVLAQTTTGLPSFEKAGPSAAPRNSHDHAGSSEKEEEAAKPAKKPVKAKKKEGKGARKSVVVESSESEAEAEKPKPKPKPKKPAAQSSKGKGKGKQVEASLSESSSDDLKSKNPAGKDAKAPLYKKKTNGTCNGTQAVFHEISYKGIQYYFAEIDDEVRVKCTFMYDDSTIKYRWDKLAEKNGLEVTVGRRRGSSSVALGCWGERGQLIEFLQGWNTFGNTHGFTFSAQDALRALQHELPEAQDESWTLGEPEVVYSNKDYANNVARPFYKLPISKGSTTMTVLIAPEFRGHVGRIRLADIFSPEFKTRKSAGNKLYARTTFLAQSKGIEWHANTGWDYRGHWYEFEVVRQAFRQEEERTTGALRYFIHVPTIYQILDYAEQLVWDADGDSGNLEADPPTWSFVKIEKYVKVRFSREIRRCLFLNYKMDDEDRRILYILPESEKLGFVRTHDIISPSLFRSHPNRARAHLTARFKEFSTAASTRLLPCPVARGSRAEWRCPAESLDLITKLDSDSDVNAMLAAPEMLEDIIARGVAVPQEAQWEVDIAVEAEDEEENELASSDSQDGSSRPQMQIDGPTKTFVEVNGMERELHSYTLTNAGRMSREIKVLPSQNGMPALLKLQDLSSASAHKQVLKQVVNFRRDFPAAFPFTSFYKEACTPTMYGAWLSSRALNRILSMLTPDDEEYLLLPSTIIGFLQNELFDGETALSPVADQLLCFWPSSRTYTEPVEAALRRQTSEALRTIRCSLASCIADYLPDSMAVQLGTFIASGQISSTLLEPCRAAADTLSQELDPQALSHRLRLPTTSGGYTSHFGTSDSMPFFECPGCKKATPSFTDWVVAHPTYACGTAELLDFVQSMMSFRIHFYYVDSKRQLFSYSSVAALLEQHVPHDGSTVPSRLPFFWAIERQETFPLLRAYGDAKTMATGDEKIVVMTVYLLCRLIVPHIYYLDMEARLSLSKACSQLLSAGQLSGDLLEQLARVHEGSPDLCITSHVVHKALVDTFPNCHAGNVIRHHNERVRDEDGSRDLTYFQVASKALQNFGPGLYVPPTLLEGAGAVIGISRYSWEVVDTDQLGVIVQFIKDGSIHWKHENGHLDRIDMACQALGLAPPPPHRVHLAFVQGSLAQWPTFAHDPTRTHPNSSDRPLIRLLPNGVFSTTQGQVDGKAVVFVVPMVATFLCLAQQWIDLLGHWRDGWIIYGLEDVGALGMPPVHYQNVDVRGRTWRFLPVYIPKLVRWLRHRKLEEEATRARAAIARGVGVHANTARVAQIRQDQAGLVAGVWPDAVEQSIYRWLLRDWTRALSHRDQMKRNRP